MTALADSMITICIVCETCGTIMAVRAEAMSDFVILKTGTLDDKEEVERHRPVNEIYNKYRLYPFIMSRSWI
jgi:hypothetical protein